jgi:NADPH2:quinone reductase
MPAMKALLSSIPGGPEKLTVAETSVPVPGKDQVRIAVKACGINYPDVLMIQDLYQFKPPRPFAPGSDVAGVVESVGPAVTELRVGDRVLASTGGIGGVAEQALATISNCYPIPDSLPFDVAASLLTTYGTSHYALHHRAALKPGETLLVLGAAGGVGIAAVELGKAAGARVIAAASSQSKVELALRHGADHGVVYSRGPFDKAGVKALADQFKSACGPQGADVIYDAVGGDYTEAALRAIAWEGRFLVIGFPAGIARIPMNLALLKSCQIVGVFYGAAVARDPKSARASIAEVLKLCEQGKIDPVVSERFPLERGAEAIARLANREVLGKVVVTFA